MLSQSTPTKYAGTKFHTTSPSPKSLPIPVFTASKVSTLKKDSKDASFLSESIQKYSSYSQLSLGKPDPLSDLTTNWSIIKQRESITNSRKKNSNNHSKITVPKAFSILKPSKSEPEVLPSKDSLAVSKRKASSKDKLSVETTKPVPIPGTSLSFINTSTFSSPENVTLDQLSTSLKQLLNVRSVESSLNV